MAEVLLRDLDDEIKEQLRDRARRNGRSMVAEIREILRDALRQDTAPVQLGTRISSRFADIGLTDDVPEHRGRPARAAAARS